ncbi:acyltransferase [uncultured Desulfobacter sp.]|uniref:acyltransferase n=1 Tax=uncultured Desulfobacter sp. TaxID=240139 RepID=UPI002AAB494F|nr:acyltransferase [uncultured Desulfobacter sp.]
MFKFIGFISKKRYWKFHSLIIKSILLFYGIKIGRNFYIEGTPHLKINGSYHNIIIGDNVSILGDVDLRNRENGRIYFHNNVTIEKECRFVSAREGLIEIGEGSIVTAFCILNGGSDIIIGRNCIIGPRSSINANEHKFARHIPVRKQGFIHAPVRIEDDCWLATNVVINKGVCLRKGSIIASNSVVTKDTEEYSINGGIPAKKIGERI